MQYQILYLFDPLCGWCYGFSKVIAAFAEKYQSQFEFVAIPGGMVTGERVAPFSTKHAYISGAYKRVEQMSGCTFGTAYLNDLLTSDTIVMDSEPPSRALITFRTFDSSRSIAFAAAMQHEHYHNGKDYNDESWYSSLAAKFDLDPILFASRMQESKMKQHVQEEFAWVRESGVQGYPTVVLRNRQKYYQLANGFTTLSELDASLVKAQKMMETVKE